MLHLREGLFDRIEIGAVGWKEPEARRRPRRPGARRLPCAIDAYLQHIDDVSYLVGSCLKYNKDTLRTRELKAKLTQLKQVHEECLARYVFPEINADRYTYTDPGGIY